MENIIVKDITSYTCFDTNKKFFLDTNVLYWYTYPRFAENLTRQARPYYDFVDALVSSGNPLYTSVYNLTELLNVVEKMNMKYLKMQMIQENILHTRIIGEWRKKEISLCK